MNFVFAATLLALAMTLTITIGSTESSESDEELDDCPKQQLLCRLQGNRSKPERCLDKRFRSDTAGLVYCNSMHCKPEEFQHDYIVRNHDQTPHKNKWKRARIGESATLHDVCLRRNGLPVTRKCQVKDMRAQWEPIDQWSRVVCMRRFRQHSISVDLNSLHDDILEGKRLTNNTQGRRSTTALMRNMFQQHDRTVLPADIHLTGQVFSELMEQPKDGALSVDLVCICREIMSSDEKVLRLSAELNATNSLLNKFEDYMDALSQQFVPRESCGKSAIQAASIFGESAEAGVEIVNYANIGVRALISSNLSVFYVNPSCENITGLAIYSVPAPDRKHSDSGFWYRFLYSSESVDKLRREWDLEVATYLPDQLWRQLKNKGASYLILKIYGHDGLFVETSQQRSRRPRSKVLSISIPGLEAVTLPQALPILLRNENHRQPDERARISGSGCGYWNYQTWLSDGITTSDAADMLRDPIIVCQTRHLTQFSFLVGGSYRTDDLGNEVLVSPIKERVLDIISIVGCSLSLFGVFGIFLTAAVFKSFRSQASTKVLMHLCLAMTLQMVLFVFINTDDISEQLVTQGYITPCVVLGALLQYSILVLFCWMLIIAFLQFQRYVTVIGIERPKHYILKAALVAWLLPLFPTLLVACIDPQSYLPSKFQLDTDTGICYPSGYGLTFGVVLPVTLITVANLVIFVYVFYSISHSLSQSIHRAERKLVSKQIRLSILLFFLLGLSWIFGIFAFMQAGVAFSYLFCLTATMQGFVLFIYFVVLDEVNRKAWLGLIWPTKMKMDVQKRTTELQSMTTSSTNYSGRSVH
ncbi:adhesion G-protein coupled receptor G7-like [Drosophila innubila]|uniref:adhesion G-protein coupled receptor G7-like n=1 Tax=Drosophila innubila TaxID=198719 RepID=UPI00148BA682|nr:adhesion G-protein coupled receptor G7-like [Drosophila innubila]